MQKLIEACRENGYRALIACITEGNEASNILHERLGFKQVSHFKKVGLKFDRWLDVADYELLKRFCHRTYDPGPTDESGSR